MFSPRLVEGFETAASLHRLQTRKGSETPYLGHFMGVASLIIEYGGDEDAVIAGLLHDAVEDCGGVERLEAIRRSFGDVVANVVEQCSDSVTADPNAKLPWKDRKRAYIAAVAAKDERALLVTACDKLHNASAIVEDHIAAKAIGGPPVWERFSGKTPEQTVAYYSALVAEFDGRIAPELYRRLAATVAHMEALVDPDGHREWVARLAA